MIKDFGNNISNNTNTINKLIVPYDLVENHPRVGEHSFSWTCLTNNIFKETTSKPRNGKRITCYLDRSQIKSDFTKTEI